MTTALERQNVPSMRRKTRSATAFHVEDHLQTSSQLPEIRGATGGADVSASFGNSHALRLNRSKCLDFRLPRPDVSHRKLLNVLPWDLAGLDHDGSEDEVRPTASDPIQPCFVSGWGSQAELSESRGVVEAWHQIRKE
jgi:hypothetical protein